ncbi:MAG: ribonuclease III [Desulfovibrio sp.]|jgi:ribonuclease-3|nr:ribonuclease III [Desulfovibrio sp.]
MILTKDCRRVRRENKTKIPQRAATPSAGRAALEKRLGHVFARPELLTQALTHSSLANERPGSPEHNERLEFLGDAVLELCVSSALFRRFPLAREGELSAMRSRLVSAGSLARLARELGLDKLLLLGRGEEMQGGRCRDSVLSDVFEALLAAVYEDGGFAAALAAVENLFAPYWPGLDEEPRRPKDYKSRLQEKTLQLFRDRPIYQGKGSHGPDHARIFVVALRLPDGREFPGSGASCKGAEQDAARMALAALQQEEPSGRGGSRPRGE